MLEQLDFNPTNLTSSLTLLKLISSCLFIYIYIIINATDFVCVCCVILSKLIVSNRHLIPTLARLLSTFTNHSTTGNHPSPINDVFKVLVILNIFLKKLVKKICTKLLSKRMSTMKG